MLRCINAMTYKDNTIGAALAENADWTQFSCVAAAALRPCSGEPGDGGGASKREGRHRRASR
jgi:hypothetical protein